MAALQLVRQAGLTKNLVPVYSDSTRLPNFDRILPVNQSCNLLKRFAAVISDEAGLRLSVVNIRLATTAYLTLHRLHGQPFTRALACCS
jgi:hypothetical protein